MKKRTFKRFPRPFRFQSPNGFFDVTFSDVTRANRKSYPVTVYLSVEGHIRPFAESYPTMHEKVEGFFLGVGDDVTSATVDARDMVEERAHRACTIGYSIGRFAAGR